MLELDLDLELAWTAHSLGVERHWTTDSEDRRDKSKKKPGNGLRSNLLVGAAIQA